MNNKVIKVLDIEHGKRVINFWKKYCDTGSLEGSNIGYYYGIINGEFGYWFMKDITKYNAEVIELPEEKTYPRIMLVSNNNIKWDPRVVFMEKCGGFLAWVGAVTLKGAESTTETCFWQYAQELKPIEVTLEDIAKWKGVSKEQIIIKK